MLVAAVGAADPLVGTVVAVDSRRAGDRIVSDADVALDDGARVRVRVLGGAVDGVAMRAAELPVLEPGERAALWLEGAWLRAKATLSRRREFSRVQADSGEPVRWWSTNCVTLVPDAAGSDDLEDGSDVEALGRAAGAWAAAADSCAHLRVVVEEPRAGLRAEYHCDGPYENVVVWLEDEWGRPGDDVPYPANRTALTTLFFVDDRAAPDDGRLLDADVEVNGVDWTFTTGACDASAQAADVENTLAHELGHVMGLDHTCDSGAGEGPDHLGNPLPSCGASPPEIVDTTMFATAPRCATYMRTPEADDVLGLCTIYPLADDPGECRGPAPLTAYVGSDDGGWCAIAPRPRAAAPGALAPVAIIASLAFARRVRDYGRVSRRATRASSWETRSRSSRTSVPAVSRN